MDLSHTLPDELWVLDDEDEVHRYAVLVADYNVYEKDGNHCLCIDARAPKKLSPDQLNPEPWIELNLKSPVDPASEDVLHASIDEMDAAETLFAIALIHGGTVSDDLFAIPSHGQMVLYADHHEQVIVECSGSEWMDRFEASMKAYGYED